MHASTHTSNLLESYIVKAFRKLHIEPITECEFKKANNVSMISFDLTDPLKGSMNGRFPSFSNCCPIALDTRDNSRYLEHSNPLINCNYHWMRLDKTPLFSFSSYMYSNLPCLLESKVPNHFKETVQNC